MVNKICPPINNNPNKWSMKMYTKKDKDKQTTPKKK